MAEFIKPFGPTIMFDQVSDGLVETVNRFAEDVLADHRKQEFFDYSHQLAGNVDREFLLELFIEKERALVLGELKAKCALYLRAMQEVDLLKRGTDLSDDNLEISTAWVVSQKSGDFNPVHSHFNGSLAGVVYLKLPDDIDAEWAQEDHHPSVGMIEFIDGRTTEFCRGSSRFRPKVGMIVLFPIWLMHTVYPFRSAQERRSLAFNMKLVER